MRLIDADRLVDMLYDNEYAMLCPLDEVSSVVDACQTVDAVSIIHCKDCAHFHPYPFEPEYGSCKYHLGPDLQWEEKKETDYCSDASDGGVIADVD